MKTVYYETVFDGDPLMCVTSKDYWDRNHFVDDGDGPDYMAISEAMEACGAVEDSTSVFQIPETGEAAIVSGMAAHGFELVKSPDFTAFLGRA